MINAAFDEINFVAIFGCYCGFALILMLKDAVIKVMTFVKGLNLN